MVDARALNHTRLDGARTRTRLALDLRAGTERWLGGLYYLHNLCLALSMLPDEEQPEIVGLYAADDPAQRLEVFEPLIEMKPFRAGDPRGTIKAKVGNRARRLLDRRAGVPFGIERAVIANDLELLFPTLKATLRGAVHLPWVMDLQHVHLPELFSRSERSFRTRAFARIAHTAPLIVFSSHVAAQHFAETFPHAEEKLRILHFRTVLDDEPVAETPPEVARRYELPESFVLMPNQFWVHKNHRLAFAAIRLLRERGTDVCLACTGSTSDYRRPEHFAELERFIDTNGLRDHIRILGIVPRNDYFQLMRAATVVVQPSAFEGWSSIVEDARALGRPMILSDIPVHVEQRLDGGVYFPQNDVEALAARIEHAVTSPSPSIPEDVAVVRQAERIREYARTFTRILDEALLRGAK